MKTTKQKATAQKSAKKGEKPAAETATKPETTPQEAPTTDTPTGEAHGPADSKKETPTMKQDTKPETANAAAAADNAPKANADQGKAPEPAAVIPAQEAKPARRYTAEEARTPQAAEAIRRTIIRAAAAAEAAPTAAQLEAYEIELRAAAERAHGKAPRWTESHSVARLCYQLGLTAEEAAKAKTKAKARAAMVEAAKSHITPTLAWQAITEIAADAAAAKAIYQALADEVDGLRSELALYSTYLAETRKGGEAAGVLQTKTEEAKARAAHRRAIDRRAKQRQAAEAIYYRHLSAHLEEGEAAAEAKAAALEEAAAYLRDNLALTDEEAKAVWEEAAKAYRD